LEKNDGKTSSLQRTMAILECLAERGTATTAQLIEHGRIPKSTAYLLLREMAQLRLVSVDDHGNYRLGVRLIALGERAGAQLDIRDVARPHLEALMERTGLLCHLGVMDNDSAYYILKIESHSTISVRSYVGKRLSLHRSGVGKCLLAWQPEALREAVIASTDYTRVTPTTLVTPEALRDELSAIRSKGWGLDNGEDVPDVRCVAAPVFGADGSVAGAISVVGPAMQITDGVVAELAPQVVACARDISSDIGWGGPAA